MNVLENDDLESRLRILGRQLDEQRAAWNSDRPDAGRATGRSWRRPALTAAVAVSVVVAALVAVAARDADAPSNTGLPSAGTSSSAPSPGVVASRAHGPVGVFPAGGAAEVAEAGYESPEEVVAAYLQSRIDPSEVPGGADITATVYSATFLGDDHAVVSVGLQMPDDGSDGYVEVVRVPAGDGGSWAVVQAFVVSLEIPEMNLEDGRLTGAVSSGHSTAVLTVSDAATGDELRSQDLGVPADPASSSRPPGIPVAVDDIAAADASVRVWITGPDGSAVPVFGEFLVRAGAPVVTGSRVIGLDAYPDYPFFADATVSAIEDLGNGEILAVTEGDDSIVVSHDIGGHTYCVTASSDGETQQSCWPLSMIAAGDAREYVGSLVYRIVPDGVTVTQDGEEIPVVGNVWFAHTDENGNTPLAEFTDGHVTQTEGGEPGTPPVASSPTPSTSSTAPPSTIVVRPAGATTPPTVAATEIASSPNAPGLYPVAEGVDPATAQFSPGATGAPFTTIAVGKVVDGEVSDAVTIYVGPADAVASRDSNGVPVTIYGQAGTVVTETIAAGEGNTIVTWGNDPTFVAVGPDPMTFLDASANSPFTLDGEPGAAPIVAVGSLPDGYELLVPPQVSGGEDVVIAWIQLGDNTVSVSAGNPAASMFTVGPTRRVDIGGSPGWAFVENPATSNDITWQVDDHTYAYLKIDDGSTPEEALALAESVTFVTLEEWLELYSPDLPNAPTPTVSPPG